jgi:hypothetical protein
MASVFALEALYQLVQEHIASTFGDIRAVPV